MPDYIDGYTEKHLPEDLQTVAELVGLDATKKLIRSFAGGFIYFPRRANRKYCQEYIIKNYNGRNGKEIYKHLGIGPTCFYSLLNSVPSKG